jgi:hypothetical protein
LAVAWLFTSCSGGQESPDVGVDADAHDGGSDDGQPDGGDDSRWGEPWAWCPQASDYQGGNWSWKLEVSPNALYCSLCDQGRTLQEELAAKSKLRLIAGSYPVPSENGTNPLLLPLCFEFLDPGSEPVRLEVGEIETNHAAQGSFMIRQPVYTATNELWEFSMQALFGLGEDTIPLNGDFLPLSAGKDIDMWLCKDSCRYFGSCSLPQIPRERHVVEFEGTGCTGDQNHCHIELILRADPGLFITGPAAFLSAAGELDGTAFDQQDFYKLIYNPEHHHYFRDFAVLFDNPINAACGIKVEQLAPQADQPQARLTTIQCDLAEIEERTITGATWEQLPD